jgi:negative regulator of flagellin synthesis FlgM
MIFMKITDTPTPAKIVSLSEKRSAESPSKKEPPARPSDPVTLSSRARELIEAQRALATIPDVRDDKVDAIKSRIADGSYRIDSEKIADKMIRDVLADDD